MKTASEVRLLAIVNSFNRVDLMRDALRTLCAALNDLETVSAVVVFDAGSTDGSAEFARAFDGGAIPIEVIGPNPRNNTFSDGINTACAHALRIFPNLTHFFLFETDNWIDSAQPIRQALALMQTQPKLGGVGFTVRKHQGAAPGYGAAFPTRLQFILGPNLASKMRMDGPNDSEWQRFEKGEWRYCDTVYTSPLLVARRAWEESGGLDAQAFPFSDCDVDWAWRLNKLGWKMAVIRSDQVVHDNRQTLSQWSENRVLHNHRGRLALLQRHRGGMGAARPLLALRHLLEFGVVLVAGFMTQNWAGSIRKRWRLLRGVFANYN